MKLMNKIKFKILIRLMINKNFLKIVINRKVNNQKYRYIQILKYKIYQKENSNVFLMIFFNIIEKKFLQIIILHELFNLD